MEKLPVGNSHYLKYILVVKTMSQKFGEDNLYDELLVGFIFIMFSPHSPEEEAYSPCKPGVVSSILGLSSPFDETKPRSRLSVNLAIGGMLN